MIWPSCGSEQDEQQVSDQQLNYIHWHPVNNIKNTISFVSHPETLWPRLHEDGGHVIHLGWSSFPGRGWGLCDCGRGLCGSSRRLERDGLLILRDHLSDHHHATDLSDRRRRHDRGQRSQMLRGNSEGKKIKNKNSWQTIKTSGWQLEVHMCLQITFSRRRIMWKCFYYFVVLLWKI